MESNSKDTKKGSMLTNIVWSYAERLLPQLVTLVVSIVLARLLSPEHYGVISIVTVFTALGDALAIGGFGNALVQKKDADAKDFNSVCWVSLGLSVVIYGVLYFCAPLIAAIYENDILIPIMRVMGLKVIFSSFNSIQQAYVQKNMIFRKSFISTIGGTSLAAVTGIGMALSGFGIWALVAQYMVNAVVNTFVLFCMIDWKPRLEVAWDRIKGLWNYGAKVLGATMVYTLRDNIRTLIVGKQFSSDDLAFYNQGQKYPSVIVVDVVEALGKVLFPVLSSKQNDKMQVKELMRLSVRVSGYIMTPLMLGLFAVSDTFVYAILTEKWAPCIPFMRILCFVYLFRPLSTVFQKGLLAIGKSNLNLTHEIITSSTTVVLLLVAVFGMQSIAAIALSHVAVALLGTVMYMLWTRKYLDYSLKEIAEDYALSLIISLVMAALVYLVGLLQINVIALLALQVFVGVVTYVACSVLLKLKPFLYVLNMLKGIVRR